MASKQLIEFMLQDSNKSFLNLVGCVGKKIIIHSNVVVDPNLPPEKADFSGVLAEVRPFDCLVLSSGKNIEFVSKNSIIYKVEDALGNTLYDKTLLVREGKTKVLEGRLGDFKRVIMGAEQAKQKLSPSKNIVKA